MPCSTYFVQECPTCGRTLQVRVEYLGKLVRCQHCGAGFEATDLSAAEPYVPPAPSSVLARANELLASTADPIEPVLDFE
jgi:lysine biosynthesis protein LysW